jgi:hypothetical protein
MVIRSGCRRPRYADVASEDGIMPGSRRTWYVPEYFLKVLLHNAPRVWKGRGSGRRQCALARRPLCYFFVGLRG